MSVYRAGGVGGLHPNSGNGQVSVRGEAHTMVCLGASSCDLFVCWAGPERLALLSS